MKNTYDAFIANASFEKRSSFASQKVFESWRPEIPLGMVLIYTDDKKEKRMRKREEQLELLNSALHEVNKNINVETIRCLRKIPQDGISQIKEKLITIDRNKLNVLIDISTLTRFYLLELLYLLLLDDLPFDEVEADLLYTTVKYGKGRYSKGVDKVYSMPNFSGSFDPSAPTVLACFLGFESDRAYAILDRYEPELTAAVITEPPSGFEEYEEKTRKANKLLLSRPGVKEFKAPAYSPDQTRETLEEIYKVATETRDYVNFVIVALGTKPQTIGIFQFWLSHQDSEITYASPEKHMKGWKYRKPKDYILYELHNHSVSRRDLQN